MVSPHEDPKSMKRPSYISLVTIIFALTGTQPVARAEPASPPTPPQALVESLYAQVVARHPLGVPYGKDKDVFAPYLSKALHDRFDLNTACFADWSRRHPDRNLKPPMGIFESGAFSGDDEKAEPKAFHIDRTEPGKNGTAQVYVRLVWGDPPDEPWVWYVAAVVIRENDRPVVDDILYLANKKGVIDSRLSERLSAQCDGGRYSGAS